MMSARVRAQWLLADSIEHRRDGLSRYGRDLLHGNLSRKSEFCDLAGRLNLGEHAGDRVGERRGLADRAAPRLYGRHDHFSERGPAAVPEPLQDLLPVALTEAEGERIAAAIDAARTESTRRVYAYTWGQWARWCAARGLSPLPGDPAALRAYLTERAPAGIAVSSLDGACTAIRHVHRMHAAPDPVASETARSASACVAPTAPHPAASPAH